MNWYLRNTNYRLMGLEQSSFTGDVIGNQWSETATYELRFQEIT